MPRLAAILALLLAVPAPALELAGVEVPEAVTSGGRTLRLNGAGLRRFLFFEIYVGALYLEHRTSDPAAIFGSDTAWRVDLRFLRDVGHDRIIGAIREAFENNSPGQLPRLLPGLERLHAVLAELRKGEQLSIAYLPGTGTTLTAPGGDSATVEGKPFGDAILRTWLGERPADGSLKQRMLGR
jgi:hypothetical protein